MQNNNERKYMRSGRKPTVLVTWVLLLALLIQALSLTCLAAVDEWGSPFGGTQNSGKQDLPIISGQANGIGYFGSDEVIAALKKDLLQTLNQDLLQKVADYDLTGPVGVILTFSDKSMITAYTKDPNSTTYEDYYKSDAAVTVQKEMADNQSSVLGKLWSEGLITEVKYNYYHMLDGAFVTTTYEQLEKLCAMDGVERVMISDVYNPASAVENPVNVYDTGIFNSQDVDYTGKGTIVAILDTGCDYAHTAFTTHDVVNPLYDRDDIAGFLPYTQAYSFDNTLQVREVYYGNITKNKIAFGYDYADKDANVMPYNSSHGTHVAGIIGGYDDTITGVAIDTQLAIMKVFSDYEQGAEDGDILAALEDCIVLGVDAINMSLGTSCGFSREADDDYKNGLYDRIEEAGISLIVAASNDFSSAFGGEQGNTNKAENPDSATVGAPSTYAAALSVASINGRKDKYMYANGSQVVFFNQSVNQNAKEYDFFEMLGITAADGSVEYEYVTIPGVGMAINYMGLDVEGKIALVRRGDISFEEKVQFAQEAGAIAVLVYNNVFGEITMTIGNYAKIPAVSIGKDEGDILAAQPSGTLVFNANNLAGPFMSDFSSWGPTPDLKLKPEITAHGGNILSAIPGGDYEEESGTSMAAPNMCGIVILIRQYVKERYPELSTTEVRDLVNQLCMSTATIARDQKGNPYSPRKQGAGIADILKATTTDAYLYVEGSGKTKLELGDDPDRRGIYTMEINLKNLSNLPVSYRVGNITMTESLSTSDPEFVAEMAYLLKNASGYSVKNGTMDGDVLTVAARETATLTVTLTLSAEDKAYLDESFVNGMFVEGFLTFENLDEKGVDLNAPFLAFYGDWAEAPIFDLDYYEVETEAHNDAIDDEDKIKADYYATTPVGTYYYDYLLPLGSYLYKMSDDDLPIIATQEKASVSYYQDCISGIYGVLAGMLRGAKEMNISIKNVATGEVVWSETDYNCYKAHYAGGVRPYFADFRLPMVDMDNNYKIFGYNNERFEVTLSAKLDWDGDTRNSNDTDTFSVYIDSEAPTVTNASYRTEYDKTLKKNRYYLDVTVYDNHYAQSIRPIVVYEYVKEGSGTTGTTTKTYSPLSEYPTPIYQQERGQSSDVTIEITDYIDLIRNSSEPEGITLYLDDYALNGNICYIPFPDIENTNVDFDFVNNTLDMKINETWDLTTYLISEDGEPIVQDYLKNLTWASSDESVVKVSAGKIEALKTGTAKITVTGDAWTYENGDGKQEKLYRTLVVNVGTEVVTNNPNSSMNVQIESLQFSHYDTLFAFNTDINYSEIGETGNTRYFGGKYSLAVYPSEKIKLYYSLEPWNLSPERYELKWSSSNAKVATVDENGVVTAMAEGKARITLQITIDGKTSLLAARLSIEVKSEFIIENRKLVAYKGWGGDVVIPDDEGIMFIGAYAFPHFDLDNKAEVEKDEDGYYDLDDKKTPLSNNTVTSVIIPEGVEYVEKYAFYHCTKLKNVTLPESCKEISSYAFAGCTLLQNINLEKVQRIANGAFSNCTSLDCADLGGIDLSHVSAIGSSAFYNTRITSVKLTNLGLSGYAAFKNCSKLEEVILGTKTRLAENMFENSAVKSIVIYADSVPDNAFKGCQKLTSVTFKNDLTYLGKNAFYNCDALKNVTFEAGCEEIADSAFYGCDLLTSFTLPNSDVKLGTLAFADSALRNLIFAKNTNIVAVGANVFGAVKALSFDTTNSALYTQTETGILYSKDGSRLVLAAPTYGTGVLTIPASVREICDGAFAANMQISTVRFEEGSLLERIGANAFYRCDLLQTVELPANRITIADMAFCECKMLKNINLDTVVSLGYAAFGAASILSGVTLSAPNVQIGAQAFYMCNSLTSVTLGEGAVIGAYAFNATPVSNVVLQGSNVTVGIGAFAECTKLTSFDFSKVVGKIGEQAFYGCTGLTEAILPNVTEIGAMAFANCYALSVLQAPKVEVIGDLAFAPVTIKNNNLTLDEKKDGAALTTIDLPALREIGGYVFYSCKKLESVNVPSTVKIGEAAFAQCKKLESIVFSDKLTVIEGYTFFECESLTTLDLSNIVTVGDRAFYAVPFASELRLDNVESVGVESFVEDEEKYGCYLQTVYAPKLKYIAEYAFGGCKKLTAFYAPNVEHIGDGAFVQTAIEKLEISDSLVEFGMSVFTENDVFQGFFVTVDGNVLEDFVGKNVMLQDGVLYEVVERGYVLLYYPENKTDEVFVVADGTVRIETVAAVGNKYLKKIVLPESLLYVGHLAFYECENLETVVFKSYYAPVLEGVPNDLLGEITPETKDQFPGFDKLYKYDFYFRSEDAKRVAIPFYYLNFKGAVGSVDADDITGIFPANGSGYDSLVYSVYFLSSEENSGTVAGKYALAFKDAVSKLPETLTHFDKAVMDAAIGAFNALEGRDEEYAAVGQEVIDRFLTARSQYNVAVVENAIEHLYSMYNSEYFYNQLKSARAAYMALSDAEKAAVSNSDRLNQKVTELTTAMGKGELNFELSYNDYFKADEPTTPDEPTDEPNQGGDNEPVDDEQGTPVWAIILIVVGAMLVFGGAAFGVVFFVKKKGSANTEAATPDAEPTVEVTENNETEENTDNGEENKEE